VDKRCRKCGEVKSLDDFYRMTGMKDGHRNECKALQPGREGGPLSGEPAAGP
jgi:hypothetical protein